MSCPLYGAIDRLPRDPLHEAPEVVCVILRCVSPPFSHGLTPFTSRVSVPPALTLAHRHSLGNELSTLAMSIQPRSSWFSCPSDTCEDRRCSCQPLCTTLRMCSACASLLNHPHFGAPYSCQEVPPPHPRHPPPLWCLHIAHQNSSVHWGPLCTSREGGLGSGGGNVGNRRGGRGIV